MVAVCGKLIPVNSALPAAVLWDYDGTVVDTQPVWLQVERDIMAAHGRAWSDAEAFATIGTSGRAACQAMIAAIGDPGLDVDEMDRLRSTMVAQRVAAGELSYRPGARELLDDCLRAGLPCALVSASPRFVLDAGLGRMPDWFAAILSGNDFTRQKPDPEGYLVAAAHLGLDPAQCLVIEDSVAGCQAGRASGAAVLGIPCMTPLDPYPGQVIRPSLSGIDAADLTEIFAAAHGER